jgi:predicted ATPase/DNA-binding SARP family transcriptional activator
MTGIAAHPTDSSLAAAGLSSVSTRTNARVRVCGPLEVELDGRRLESLLTGRKIPQLVAYLAINRGRVVRRDELIDVIWSTNPPQRPDGAFATLLARTRSVLGADVLRGGTQLVLDLGAEPWIDWEVAMAGADSAGKAFREGRPAEALRLAGEALGILDQTFLPGFEASWIDDRRRELDEQRFPLCDALARAALALGGPHVATAERAARTVIAEQPFRERGYAMLMEALAAAGDTAEALRTYDTLRTLLREELGLTPAPSVTAMAERLLRQAGQEQAPDPAPSPAPLPAAPTGYLPFAVAANAEKPMAGRDAQRDQLLEAARTAATARGRVALVHGEPGIGKTRLVVCVASELHRHGWNVFYGRTDRESPLTYQPVIEALRHYGAQHPARVPQLEELLERGSEGSADLDRYRLFEAVAATFASAAAERPTLLILDDLHWADASTLTLIRHVVRSTADCRLFLLGTFRDVDPEVQEPMRIFMDELWHGGSLDLVPLTGLGVEATGELVHELVPDAEPGLVGLLQSRTNGNPFFVEETLRGLAQPGLDRTRNSSGLPLPDHVKQLIGWRVARLPTAQARMLRAASVLGPEFHLPRAAALAGCSVAEAFDAVEAARRAGLVVADSNRVDRYAFRHALTRDALYEALTPGECGRAHLTAAEQLERQPRGADPAELALHFFHARYVGGAERAVHWRREAAEQATRRHAHEEAVEHYERALEALELIEDDGRLCARILLGEGQSLIRAGSIERGRERLSEAGNLARRLGAADILADSVLDSGAFYLSPGEVSEDLVEVLEEALQGLASEEFEAHQALRARVMARLTVALYWDPERRERGKRLADEAVAVASASGDRRALAFAVGSRHCAHWVSERPADLLQEAERTIELSQRAGDEELELVARTWRVNHLLGLARVDAVDEEIVRFVALADRLRQSRCAWYAPLFLAIRALMNARFAEAEKLIMQAAELGGRVPGSPSPLVALGQIFVLRWFQGRLGELEGALASFVEQYPAVPAWRCALAITLCEEGRHDRARALLDEVASEGFDSFPHDNLWLASMMMLAQTCAVTGAREHAPALARRLQPLAGLSAVAPTTAWFGPVDRALAGLAAVQERPDEALAYLARAAALCEQARSPAAAALVQLDRAEVLLLRDNAADAVEARKLARAALATAETTGMRYATVRALGLLSRPGSGAPRKRRRNEADVHA